jgi:hypothetical protein
VLGVPTVADRVAQTVVKLWLDPKLDPLFHADSYGYRPGRSAHDAIAVTKRPTLSSTQHGEPPIEFGHQADGKSTEYENTVR